MNDPPQPHTANSWQGIHLRRFSYMTFQGAPGEPEVERWLSAGEREIAAQLRDPQRREAWIWARIIVKEMVLDRLLRFPYRESVVSPREVEIYSRDPLGRPCRPRVIVQGRLQPWRLSISHTERSVTVALSPRPDLSIGVDATSLGRWSAGSMDLWFTPWEHCWLQRAGNPVSVAIHWALKEALYKAVNRGELFVPAQIEVRPTSAGGYSCSWNDGKPQPIPFVRIERPAGEITALVAVTRPSKATL